MARDQNAHERATAALLEVAREISGRLDLTECLNGICRITGAVLHADRCQVILWSGRKRGFLAYADVGTPPDLLDRFRGVAFSLYGSTYMTQLAAGETAVLVRDQAEDAGRKLLDDLRLSTQVIAPFSGPDAPVGALVLGYERPVELTAYDLDLLRGITQQAAVAIRTVRHLNHAQKAAQFRTSLTDLAIRLSRERDVDGVVAEVCEAARTTLSVDTAVLALVGDDGQLTIRGVAGDFSDVLRGRSTIGQQASASHVRQFYEGRAWHVNRCRQSGDSASLLLTGVPTEAVLIAPLLADERPVGVLMLVDLHDPDRFGKVHLEEATILAATAGAWIENSRLLAALREESEKLAERTRHLEDANRALARKTNEVQNANRALEELIYVASHDLRAPLINLDGFAYELAGQVSDLRGVLNGRGDTLLGGVEESVRFIRSATERMNALVRGLLSVSRCGARELLREPVDVQALVAAVVETHHFALSSAGITVRLGELPSVSADPIGLSQVFDNLIGNAIKYMHDAPRRLIEIEHADADGMDRFCVRDSGPGISLRDRELVFRLFQRGAGGDLPGEGIGLTIVRRIIERHGGSAWVDSELGQGATFWFTLPKETA